MVNAALQAEVVERRLMQRTGAHRLAAHEALLLPYEMSFLHTDNNTGKQYLLSCDLPWIGLRTNSPDGEHVKLLKGVENSVGIKLGPDTTQDHINMLCQALDPGHRPGKLVFMLRMGVHATEATQITLNAIKQARPESLVLYDMHGCTATRPNGTKIRAVNNIIEETHQLAVACGRAGLRLSGVHLETIMDDTRLECVNIDTQDPTHPGNIDPQLNPTQLTHVLDTLAPVLAKELVWHCR